MKTTIPIDKFFGCLDEYNRKKSEVRNALFELHLLECSAKKELNDILDGSMSFGDASCITNKYKRYGFSNSAVKEALDSVIDICIKPDNEKQSWFKKIRCINISSDSFSKYHLSFSFACDGYDGWFDILVPTKSTMNESIDEFESTNYGLYLVVAHVPFMKTMMYANNGNANEIANDVTLNKIVAKSFSPSQIPSVVNMFMNNEFTDDILCSIVDSKDKISTFFACSNDYSYSIGLDECTVKHTMMNQSIEDVMFDTVLQESYRIKEMHEIKKCITDYSSFMKSTLFKDEN